jgi:hypothetical protein
VRVEAIRDLSEVPVVVGQAVDVVKLRAVAALEPRKHVQVEFTHRQGHAPLTGFFPALSPATAPEMGLICALEKRRCRFVHRLCARVVLRVNHACLYPRQSGKSEPPERTGPAPKQHVHHDPEILRSSEEVVGVLQAGGGERKRGELLPEGGRVAAPHNVGVHEKRPVERLVLVEMMLEPDDGPVLRRQIGQDVEARVQPPAFQQGAVVFRTEEGDGSVWVMSPKRMHRCDGMLYVPVGAVAVKDVALAGGGHRGGGASCAVISFKPCIPQMIRSPCLGEGRALSTSRDIVPTWGVRVGTEGNPCARAWAASRKIG